MKEKFKLACECAFFLGIGVMLGNAIFAFSTDTPMDWFGTFDNTFFVFVGAFTMLLNDRVSIDG